MMNDMKTKGETMLAEEAKTYAAYSAWAEGCAALNDIPPGEH